MFAWCGGVCANAASGDPVKVVVVGGTSQSTPWLFLSEAVRRCLNTFEFQLTGRSRGKLDAVIGAIAALTNGRAHVRGCVEPCADIFDGAGVVILQARYG